MKENKKIPSYEENGMFFTRVFSLGADRLEAKITKRLEYQQEISFEL